MARHYTLCFHDEHQNLVAIRRFEAENDIEAFAEAQSVVKEQTIEILEGSRQVGAIKASIPLKLYI